MKRNHCEGHDIDHVHGPGCGHARVLHDGHYDYVVGDHLHHVGRSGCEDHGSWLPPAAAAGSGGESSGA